MHAVMLSVSFDDFEAAGRDLRDRRVPRLKQLPGFVAAYWVAFDGGKTGRSMMAFESEEDPGRGELYRGGHRDRPGREMGESRGGRGLRSGPGPTPVFKCLAQSPRR
jgi:hypothetical protein